MSRLALYAATAAAIPAAAANAGVAGLQVDGNLSGSVYNNYTVLTLTVASGVDVKFKIAQFNSTMFGAPGSYMGWAVSAGTNGAIAAVTAGSLLSNLSASDVINSAAGFGTQAFGFLFDGSNGAEGGSAGHWANGATAKSGYVGFKSGDRYGWVEVTWSFGGIGNHIGTLTIGDYAVGASGQTVMAGITPPVVPGLGGLAALACGAAGVRRQRTRIA